MSRRKSVVVGAIGLKRRAGASALLLTSVLMGCIAEKGTAPTSQSATSTIGTTMVTPPNAILAVGGTVQLGVTGRTLTGAPITAFDSVQYVLSNTSDTLRVRVAPSGLVTGVGPSSTSVQLKVIAFKDGFAKGDIAILQVTASTLPNVQLSIQPVAPDSAKVAQNQQKVITPILRSTSTGQNIANPSLRYTINPSDVNKLGVFGTTISTATLADGELQQYDWFGISSFLNMIFATARTGSAWVYANVNVYGTLLQDSVQYTFLNPTSGSVFLTFLRFAPTPSSPVTYLQPGGTVTFSQGCPAALNCVTSYTFDTPGAATAATPPSTNGGTTGNVSGLAVGQSSVRRFLVPGTYTWTGAITGAPYPYAGGTATGQIIVQ